MSEYFGRVSVNGHISYLSEKAKGMAVRMEADGENGEKLAIPGQRRFGEECERGMRCGINPFLATKEQYLVRMVFG